MNIFVINKYNKGELVKSDFVPRVGDKVDMFYDPLPTVTSVVAWPSKDRLAAINMSGYSVNVIVTVE